jgi:hypothetical protein
LEEHTEDDSLDQIYKQHEESVHLGGNKIIYKRATDLIMPPFNIKGIKGLKTFCIADYELEKLTADLEGARHTGCIKTSSKAKLSRSAALLYRGRVVGCICSSKENPTTGATAEALAAMGSALGDPSTEVTVYDLPEDVIAPLSALFLGRPLDRNLGMTEQQHYDYMLKSLADNKSTACVASVGSGQSDTCFILMRKGEIVGHFFAEEQQFSHDPILVRDLFERWPDAVIQVSVLPADTLAGMHFGYSLSMLHQKWFD